MYKVFLADHIAPEARRRLEERVELVDRFDRPEELDAIIVRQTALPGDVIRRAVKCRVIQMHGIGLERIDTCAAAEMGIPVLITRGGNNESVAELVVALVLALARKLKYVDQGMREGRFARHGTRNFWARRSMESVSVWWGAGRSANSRPPSWRRRSTRRSGASIPVSRRKRPGRWAIGARRTSGN